MLTERSIINFLIWIAGLIIGPYLACSILWGNLAPIVVIAAGTFLFFMFAIFKDMLCLGPIIGLSLAGKILLIPGKPDYFEFAATAAILYYVIAYGALRRRKLLTGPLFLFIPIVALAGIVFYHDPHASLRFEGGGREGGRGVVDLMLAALAYVCCVSMNTPSARFFAWTPIYCIIGGTLTNIPYIVTSYLPSTASIFFLFTDNINMGAYMEDTTGSGGDVVRNGAQAGFGSSLAIFLLCYYPVQTWWRPNRWWIALLFAVCTWFVVDGGFRSNLVGFVFMMGLTIWCRAGWRTLSLVPPIFAAMALIIGLQNNHLVKLPESAQRTLSFLPADWDSVALESTKSSNEFRDRISKLYLEEEAGKNPLLGNGITYDSGEFVRATFMAQTFGSVDSYYATKLFLTGKMFHTGWISAYDATGLVGCALFTFLALSLIWNTGKIILRKDADRESPLFPLKIWLFCSVTGSVFAFLTLFGDFKAEFAYFCAVSIVWTHLDRLEKYGYQAPVHDRVMSFDPDRTQVPVTA